METNNSKLQDRLVRIWQTAEFDDFFNKFSKKTSIHIKKGTVLFNEGQPLDQLYFIKAGFVKLYRLSEGGRESTVYLYGPGQLLGIRALTSKDACARHYAEAITDLKITTISRKDYLKVVSLHPEYLIDLLHVFIDRLNYTEKKLAGFILTNTVARVAFFLLDCTERFKKDQIPPFELPLDLTHQRIAEFVGSFRETVTVAMQKLEKMGVVRMKKGKVKILNFKKLQEFASL